MSVLYGKGYGEDLRLCMSRLDCDYKMRSGICSLAWSYYPVRNSHRLENHVDYLLNGQEKETKPIAPNGGFVGIDCNLIDNALDNRDKPRSPDTKLGSCRQPEPYEEWSDL
jgi:hypothetical protein